MSIAVLKEVITLLLMGESCIHSSHNGFVHFLEDGPHHFAIERILRSHRTETELADMVIEHYLERFDRDRNTFLGGTDALGYAERIATEFPISAENKERFITALAHAGWYGRIEESATKLCGRGLRGNEVILLFDKYLKGACYSDTTDAKLCELASRYLPKELVEEQKQKIQKRNEDARSFDF